MNNIEDQKKRRPGLHMGKISMGSNLKKFNTPLGKTSSSSSTSATAKSSPTRRGGTTPLPNRPNVNAFSPPTDRAATTESMSNTRSAFNPFGAGDSAASSYSTPDNRRGYEFNEDVNLRANPSPSIADYPADDFSGQYSMNQSNRPMDTITRANGSVTSMSDVLAERRRASAAIGNVSGQAPLSTSSGGPRSSQYGQEAQDIVSRMTQPFGGPQQAQPEWEGFVDPATADTVGLRRDTTGRQLTNTNRFNNGYGVSSPQIDALKAKAAETDAFYRDQLPSQYDPVDQQVTQEDSVRSFTQTSPETLTARANAQAYENPLDEQQTSAVAPAPMDVFSTPLGSSATQDDNPYSVMNQVKALDKKKAEEEREKKMAEFRDQWQQRRSSVDNFILAKTNAYNKYTQGPQSPEQKTSDSSPYGDERNPGGRSRYDTRWKTNW